MGVLSKARGMLLAASLLATSQAGAQSLNIGVRAGPESMDPHFSALGVHVEALKHIFDTLVRSDETLQVRTGPGRVLARHRRHDLGVQPAPRREVPRRLRLHR